MQQFGVVTLCVAPPIVKEPVLKWTPVFQRIPNAPRRTSESNQELTEAAALGTGVVFPSQHEVIKHNLIWCRITQPCLDATLLATHAVPLEKSILQSAVDLIRAFPD